MLKLRRSRFKSARRPLNFKRYGDMTAAKFRSKAAEILSSTAALRRGSTANTATFGFF